MHKRKPIDSVDLEPYLPPDTWELLNVHLKHGLLTLEDCNALYDFVHSLPSQTLTPRHVLEYSLAKHFQYMYCNDPRLAELALDLLKLWRPTSPPVA